MRKKTESNEENTFQRASVVAVSAQLLPGQSEKKREERLKRKGIEEVKAHTSAGLVSRC